jgi:response regulator RpfG family c-di-GMP phosphodiesterase
MEKNVVLRIIRENSGTQFDPRVVDAFLRIADQIHEDD